LFLLGELLVGRTPRIDYELLRSLMFARLFASLSGLTTLLFRAGSRSPFFTPKFSIPPNAPGLLRGQLVRQVRLEVDERHLRDFFMLLEVAGESKTALRVVLRTG
jgi:hypothetical protein